MDVLWLSIGVLIGWIAAWFLGPGRPARDEAEVSLAPGVARELGVNRRIRYHAFRAVVALVIIGVILTVWVMKAV